MKTFRIHLPVTIAFDVVAPDEATAKAQATAIFYTPNLPVELSVGNFVFDLWGADCLPLTPEETCIPQIVDERDCPTCLDSALESQKEAAFINGNTEEYELASVQPASL